MSSSIHTRCLRNPMPQLSLNTSHLSTTGTTLPYYMIALRPIYQVRPDIIVTACHNTDHATQCQLRKLYIRLPASCLSILNTSTLKRTSPLLFGDSYYTSMSRQFATRYQIRAIPTPVHSFLTYLFCEVNVLDRQQPGTETRHGPVVHHRSAR